ncbi:MAG: hypothetical protein M1835_007591 [Candelina submexicana]|nr:MAG: hypothetical protein M1835_007591 [Candelina submexicana]
MASIEILDQDIPIPLQGMEFDERDYWSDGVRVFLYYNEEGLTISAPKESLKVVTLNGCRLLAIMQGPEDVRFSIESPTNDCCVFYYDPWGDGLILINQSKVSIRISILPKVHSINPGKLMKIVAGPSGATSAQPRCSLTKRQYHMRRVKQKKKGTELHPLDLKDGQTLLTPRDLHKVTRHESLATVKYSSVYRACHSHLDGPIVVKVMKPREAGPLQESNELTVTQIKSWDNEFKVQKRLDHKSIVKLYSGDARYSTLFLEYICGNDLAEWRDVDNYFLGDEDVAFQIWYDMAGALAYLHKAGIEHNDIKPSNIIYSKQRGAVLCDFGIACHTGTDLIITGGTPWYIAPEWLTQGVRGMPADVYALAVSLLYVYRVMPLADARGGLTSGVYWIIADVWPHRHSGPQPAAVKKMQAWLGEIKVTMQTLEGPAYFKQYIKDMLKPIPRTRLRADEVYKLLSTLSISKSAINRSEGFVQTQCSDDAQPVR